MMEIEHDHTKSGTRTRRPAWLRYVLLALGGFIAGVLALAVIHFVHDKPHHTHYHANFALYISGQPDEFKLPTYYEEVQSCGGDESNPRVHAHMHDNDSASVHVHADGVTWGHFFANLGYGLSNRAVVTSKGVYTDGQDGNSLQFILNGQKVYDVANRVIGDKDVLLVSYGNESSETLQSRFAAIPRTAAKYDANKDPAACAGSEELLSERIRASFGF